MPKNFCVRLSDDLSERLKTEADNQGRTVANLLRLIAVRYLEKKENAESAKS